MQQNPNLTKYMEIHYHIGQELTERELFLEGYFYAN